MELRPMKNLPEPKPKALIFDPMGTCLDWHSSIVPVLSNNLPKLSGNETTSLALDWRQAFFDEIHHRFELALPPEDIDETHRRTLTKLLSDRGLSLISQQIEDCVKAWHHQTAWPDVTTALPLLRANFDVIVLANGTSRLQIDITKSADLQFDLLLSSELLGVTKPDPVAYLRAMELLKRDPAERVMVAAHAYDLRAAKAVGMRTVYVRRWTEDPNENMERIEAENDVFIDARGATRDSGGLIELARILGILLAV